MRILERASTFRKAHQGARDSAALIASPADQLSAPSEGTEMLWTILIIALIVLVVMAIFGRGRFSR
jgi:hypothetical protein